MKKSSLPAPSYDWPALAWEAHFQSRELAPRAGMDPRTLRRRFHREFGTTPQRWLEALRMKLAKKLLRSKKSVKAVAYELFFKQPSHFCRRFKQAHGLPAQAWQRTNGQ